MKSNAVIRGDWHLIWNAFSQGDILIPPDIRNHSRNRNRQMDEWDAEKEKEHRERESQQFNWDVNAYRILWN